MCVRSGAPPACDVSRGPETRWRLEYDVYSYFLPENDLSEQSLFASIQAVADTQGLTQNAKLVCGGVNLRQQESCEHIGDGENPVFPRRC